jgi:hypothetical protein
MPISFKQAGSLFVAGPNITIFSSGNTYAISGSPFGGGIGSGVTGVTSSGTGQYLFLLPDLVENQLQQKAISAGTGMNISEDGLSQILTFSVGSANLGSAVTGLTSSGTGNRLIFSSITNNNLVQKSLSGGTGIAIVDSGTGTLTFSSTSTSNGTIISGTNAGTGIAIFSGAVGSNLVFRRILSGSNIGVYTSGNDIVISGASGAINGITGVSNQGGGSSILSSVTGNILVSRTISGSGGIVAYESGNNIIIRPTGLTASRLVISDSTGGLTTSDNFQIDSTNSFLAIGGVAAVSSTRLLIAAGSATQSQIRIGSNSGPYSGATAGDIYYSTTSGNSLFFNKTTSSPTPFIFKDNNWSFTGTSNARILSVNTAGTINIFGYLTNLGIFNSLTSTTISGTSELSVFNSGNTFLIGTNILNSSTHGSTPQLISGKKFRFNAKGTITSVSSPGTITSRLKLGSTIILSSTSANISASMSGKYFEIDTTFTIRSSGASGKAIGSGKILMDDTSPIYGIPSLGEITIDTTTDKIFDFTLILSNGNNVITITESTLEYLN